ncbi:MAG: DUF1570 domain-containing protein [Planctomycetota bacterium]
MNLSVCRKKVIACTAGLLLALCGLGLMAAKSNEETYKDELTRIESAYAKEHYQLGLWCLKNNLLAQARKQFERVLELDPGHKAAREKLEAVNKLIPYKGALDKPSVDKEEIPWDKAGKKETAHFIVRTNLSADALDDICILMETAYPVWQKLFDLPEPEKKLNIAVTRTLDECQKVGKDIGMPEGAWGDGLFCPRENTVPYEDYLLIYCSAPGRTKNVDLAPTLLHEGAHWAMALFLRSFQGGLAPVWLNEGLASYFESGKMDGDKLAVNFVNNDRLPVIQKALSENNHIKPRELINISMSQHMNRPELSYPGEWSLVYFLMNASGGKYKQGLQSYIKGAKAKKVKVTSDAGDFIIKDKDGHTKFFEECAGIPIDQLEKEWKAYILDLK